MVLADGAVAVVGYVSSIEAGDAASVRLGGFVRDDEPDGRVRSTQDGGWYTDQEITAVAHMPDGGLVMASTEPLNRPFRAFGPRSVSVRRLDRTGGERWTTRLSDEQHDVALAVLPRGDDRLSVVVSDLHGVYLSVVDVDESVPILSTTDLDDLIHPIQSTFMSGPRGDIVWAGCDMRPHATGNGHVAPYRGNGPLQATARILDGGLVCPLVGAVAADGSVVIGGHIRHGYLDAPEAFLIRLAR